MVLIELGILSMKHRTATTIIAEILHLASFRLSKSKIMYGAFLSHHQIQFYLEMLAERRLIAKEESSNVYKTTETGMQFLELYKQLEGFIPNHSPKHSSMPASPSGSPR